MDTPAAKPPIYLNADRDDEVDPAQKVGYGLGCFIDMWGHWLYPTFAYLVFMTYLGVRPTYVGIVIILNRLFDGMSDPLFGWLSDNTRTRIGRRRPFMLVGAVIAGLGLPLLVAVRPGWGSVHMLGHSVPTYFFFMLASSAVYLPMVSCFNMPYQSLGYELTPDYNERTSVFAIKNVIQKVPELGLFFCGQFVSMSVWVGATRSNLVQHLKALFTFAGWSTVPAGAQPNLLLGSQVFCAIAGCIMMVAGLVSALTVKERYYDKVVSSRQKKISIKEAIWQTLSCQPFRVQVIMCFAYSMGTSLVGTLGYTDTIYYVCKGNVSVGSYWNFWMGLGGSGFGLIGIPVFSFISRIVGKRNGLMIVMAVAAAVFVGCWWLYTPSVVWLQIFATGLIAFTSAGFYVLKDSMVADIVDYDEFEGGRRREGAFAASNSWIIKFGMAIGAGLSFVILDWIGFKSALGADQTPHAIFMLRFLFSAIPVAGLILSVIALARFPLTPARMEELRTKLEAKRGTV